MNSQEEKSLIKEAIERHQNENNKQLENDRESKLEEAIEQGNNFFNEKNYIKASSLFRSAKLLTDDPETQIECDTKAMIADAMFYSTCDNYAEATQILAAAKKSCTDSRLLDLINSIIDEIDEHLEYKKALELFDEACRCANSDNNYEKAIDMFKKVKQKTNDKNLIDSCNENINILLENIKNQKYAEKIDNLYEKACSYYNQGNYKTAMQYFKEAKDYSDDYDFRRQCEQDIKDCQDCIDGEIENEAIDYYNDGVWYYNNGEYEKAKWKFEDAYKTSSNRELREKCLESIEDCKELLC